MSASRMDMSHVQCVLHAGQACLLTAEWFASLHLGLLEVQGRKQVDAVESVFTSG